MAAKTNVGLVEHMEKLLGMKYVMGTACKVLTTSALDSLIKSNPNNWFTAARIPTVRTWVGQVTTDCHGAIEGYVNDNDGDYVVESGEGTYDTTADGGFSAAKVKGTIGTIDKDMIGICVRYPGHVGVYAGDGIVIEARGYGYGVCKTKLSARPWTHWYQHPKLSYLYGGYPKPTSSITPTSKKAYIKWLQYQLNIALADVEGFVPLKVDGIYGAKTAAAVILFWIKKKWKIGKKKGYSAGMNTIKALAR